MESPAPRKRYKKLPTVLVLDRLRSAFNTGNIFRLADAAGAEKVYCCGYTPAPPHPKLLKTAMGAAETVPFEVVPDSLTAIRKLKQEGYYCVAVEVGEDAVEVWDQEFQFPLALVFGNEALGVAEETIKECDALVCLPMFGSKTSTNVGNCAAAILYALIGKYGKIKPEEKA